MIILEGCRKSGKSFTTEVVKKSYLHLIFHKDLGMRIITEMNTSSNYVDPDDYAIGRDLAYAQFLNHFQWEPFAYRLFFDRSYFSSYVYGQVWRSRFSKEFWQKHIERVEKAYGEFLKRITVVFLTLSEADFQRIESMDRKKDKWDITTDYRDQYDLYQEAFRHSMVEVLHMPAFMPESKIVEFFNPLLLGPER